MFRKEAPKQGDLAGMPCFGEYPISGVAEGERNARPLIWGTPCFGAHLFCMQGLVTFHVTRPLVILRFLSLSRSGRIFAQTAKISTLPLTRMVY